MDLELHTKAEDDATTGVLTGGGLNLYSIELPWRDNVAHDSCVPAGRYDLIPYMSPKHGATWCLHNPSLGVYSGTSPRPPGVSFFRTYCELHAANWAEELEGCIAFGLDCKPMYNPITRRVSPAIEHSRDAIAMLLSTLVPMTLGHTLTITREL